MSRSSDWPIEIMPVEALTVDPHNVRINVFQPNEESTLAFLYDNADVMSLVRDIAADTWFDNEPPIVTRESGQWIVLEGNRRVSALKGLLNPNRIPSFAIQLRGVVSRLEDPAGDVPAAIRVLVAPDRESAQTLLARMHTRTGKKSWGLEEQAAFYYSRLGNGTTVNDLKIRYASIGSKVVRFITMAEMARLFRDAAKSDPEALQFVDSTGFKLTALEYLYKSAVFQAAVGLTVDQDGFVNTDGRDDFRERVMIQVVKDLKTKYFSTRGPRALLKSPEHKDYVQSLADIAHGLKPDHWSILPKESGPSADADEGQANTGVFRVQGDSSSPGAGGDESTHDTEIANSPGGQGGGSPVELSAAGVAHPDDGADPANEGSDVSDVEDGETAGVPRVPNRSVHDNRLYFDGLELRLHSAGLRVRFEELRTIDVKNFPNGTMDMIRTFLECALKEYFRQSNNRMPPGKAAQLSHCLEHASKHFAANKRMTQIINNLKSRGPLAKEDYLKSAEALNGSNHEPDVVFSRQQVNETWRSVYPLVKELLAGTPAATAAAPVGGK